MQGEATISKPFLLPSFKIEPPYNPSGLYLGVLEEIASGYPRKTWRIAVGRLTLESDGLLTQPVFSTVFTIDDFLRCRSSPSG